MFSKKTDGSQGTLSVTAIEKISTNSTHSSVLAPSAYANTAEANYSIINEFLTMKGDLESEADILIKGRVQGNIKCKLLIVDTGARVEGGVEAEEIVIRGTTKGVVMAKRVRIEKSADVDSDIYHQNFSAEEGAKIRGALHFKTETATEPAKKTAVKNGAAGMENGAAGTAH